MDFPSCSIVKGKRCVELNNFIEEQAKEEDCEPCRLGAGIGILLGLCNTLKEEGFNIDCKSLQDKIENGTITVKKFTADLRKMVKRTGDGDSLITFDQIKDLMYAKG